MDSRWRTARLTGSRGPSRRWAFFVVPACAAAAALSAALGGQAPAAWPPPTLRDTGLYSDWATRTVAADNLPFSPQYPLWSDGAEQVPLAAHPEGDVHRRVEPGCLGLPGRHPRLEGVPIRATRGDPPHRAHARGLAVRDLRLERRRDRGHARARGRREVQRPDPGRRQARHTLARRLPRVPRGRACAPARRLGAAALARPRSERAHAEPPPPGAIDLTTLVSRGLLRGTPAHVLNPPPRVAAASPTERAALGYLHSNCGSCHVGTGELRSLAFALNYTLNRPPGEPAPALATSIGQPSRFKVPGADDVRERISQGRPGSERRRRADGDAQPARADAAAGHADRGRRGRAPAQAVDRGRHRPSPAGA